jgi:hypothetical protein
MCHDGPRRAAGGFDARIIDLLYDSLDTWQILLPAAWIAIGLIGLAHLVRKPKGSRPDAAALRRRRLLGIALIGLAVGGYFATDPLVQPRAAPLPSAVPAPTRVDGTSFASSEAPGLRVEAPEGWRVDFDQESRTLRLVSGSGPWASAPAHLHIESAHMKDATDAPGLLGKVEKIWIDNGLSPGERFERSVGGLRGVGALVKTPDPSRSFAILIVPRPAQIVSTLQCFVTDGGDPLEACDVALDRIEWMQPQ